jgi:ATP-dependent helicase/nuclease subunit A
MPEAAPEARAAMLAEAERAMAAPGAGAVFGPDALAEAAFAADIPGLGRVDGRIDRLAVEAGRVLAVDFKSDAAPPETPEAVPEAYLRQMAAYHAALTALHPDSAVEVALLWTAAARLMPLPPALLDAALARAVSEAR